jgi:hypothetical protein
MLYLETVESGTFSVLETLMQVPELQDFDLVGGTALSLMYGHRKSIDLDLFSNKPFDAMLINQALINHFPDRWAVRTSNHFGIFGFINDLKIDIVKFPHPLIRPTRSIEGIRMYSAEDIIAMKVQAILGRGKKKDFWDIAELLQHYSVADFIQFHKEKYATQNLFISAPQAMTYFVDAEESEDPISLKGQTWSRVKRFIQQKVSEYLR